MKNILLIVNPVSGKKTAVKNIDAIKSIFEESGIKTTEYYTQKSKDAEETTIKRAGEFDTIVCVGGDGTLNEVISGMVKSGCSKPIGYIPSGTTNDFANTLGLSKDAIQAARDILTGTQKEIDIGDMNGHLFSYIASFGAFTSCSHSTPQALKNKLGHAAYLLGSVKDLFNIKPYRIKITADGVSYDDEFMFGAICNSTSIGGLFKMDESMVDMSDGVFETVAAKMVHDPFSLLKRISEFKNRSYPSENIKFFKASEVTFEFDKKTAWALDGEFVQGDNKVTIKNLNKKIKLILK